MSARVLFLLCLLTVCSAARAEHGCHDGFIPLFQGNSQNRTCVADYSLPHWNQSGQQEFESPPARWADQWGAIATDSEKGILGVAVDMPSKKKAEKTALKVCKAKGGSVCEVEVAYYNQCAVMVIGDLGYGTAHAVTIDQAEKIGLNKCQENYKNCRVYYSGCSLPKRIQ